MYRENAIFAIQKTAETDQAAVWDGEWGGPKESCIRWRAHWHHLANIIELFFTAGVSRSVTRDGDAACSQITSHNLVVVVSETTDGYSEGKSGGGELRSLLGVMRTGLFASGLLVAGECIVELVLLTADKPTSAMLHSVVSRLTDELPVRQCLCVTAYLKHLHTYIKTICLIMTSSFNLILVLLTPRINLY